MYENENTAYQNLSDAIKAVVGKIFIALISQISRGAVTQIKKLSYHYRNMEKMIKSQARKKNQKNKDQSRNQ